MRFDPDLVRNSNNAIETLVSLMIPIAICAHRPHIINTRYTNTPSSTDTRRHVDRPFPLYLALRTRHAEKSRGRHARRDARGPAKDLGEFRAECGASDE